MISYGTNINYCKIIFFFLNSILHYLIVKGPIDRMNGQTLAPINMETTILQRQNNTFMSHVCSHVYKIEIGGAGETDGHLLVEY